MLLVGCHRRGWVLLLIVCRYCLLLRAGRGCMLARGGTGGVPVRRAEDARPLAILVSDWSCA